MASRKQILSQTSQKLLQSAAAIPGTRALLGFDGFVDEIIAVVDKRQDAEQYQPIRTIESLGKKILKAAGQSSNYELVVKQMKLGGNGPIMANALAAIGFDVTYIGNLGYPTLHPVFTDLARRAKAISIAEAAHTDALEFEDGKLMLGKMEALAEVNWENLTSRLGKGVLEAHFAASSLIGMVNWTMLSRMSDIWSHLLAEVLPKLPKAAQRRTVFIDLADPEKRTAEDIAGALKLLWRMQEFVDVTLGLNLKEAGAVSEVLGLEAPSEGADDWTGDDAGKSGLARAARRIRDKLDVHCVVVHPRRGAAAATAGGAARFAGPFVEQPKISTGAGDHFNAGFCAGRALGMGLEQSLCVGVATSGYYVRSAVSPSAEQLASFIAELPPPEGG